MAYAPKEQNVAEKGDAAFAARCVNPGFGYEIGNRVSFIWVRQKEG